jgi:hypothetical protein
MSSTNKYISQLKTLAAVGLFSLGVLLGIEAILLYGFNYREFVKGEIDCKVTKENFGYQVYRPNCELHSKHWEQDNAVIYKFNEFGRREPDQQTGSINLAFFGDSFTMGAMVPIEKNYNFRALQKLENPKYQGHNFGVAAAQFHDILTQIEHTDTSKYEFIIYGITPNDLFDIVDGTDPSIKVDSSKQESIVTQSKLSQVKNLILSSATSRFMLHNIMSADSVYLQTYKTRMPYAGYLSSPLPEKFVIAIDHVMRRLNFLEQSKRDKLIIFLLPQKAEVVAAKLGKTKNAFRDYFITTCRIGGFKCAAADVLKLSKLPESHYPVDGHLTISGNELVAEDLSLALFDLIY